MPPDKKRKAKLNPPEIMGGAPLTPKPKTWNTGSSFVPPALTAARASRAPAPTSSRAPVIDEAPPRKKASNRRILSAKQIKEIVPKKKSHRKSLAVPEGRPTQLEAPEEGSWINGQWVDNPNPDTSRKAEDGEEDVEEEDELDASDNEEGNQSPAASPDETMTRLIPPILGHKGNQTQREINRGTTSSSTHKRTPSATRKPHRLLSPASLRALREVGEEDDPPRPMPQPLFAPRPPSEESSLDDLEDVEDFLPPGTLDHGALRSWNAGDNVTASRSTADMGYNPSGALDSYNDSGVGEATSAQPTRLTNLASDDEEMDVDEDENPQTDKENVSASSRSRNKINKTYSKRHKYTYRNAEAATRAYSQPTVSQLPPPPAQLPPSRNPALSREREMSRDYDMEVDLPTKRRSRRSRREMAYYSDDEDDDPDNDHHRQISLPVDDDPKDPNWEEEFKAMKMFATDSLESWTQYPTPPGMVPVTAAFQAGRYTLPASAPGQQHVHRPPPQRPYKPIPLFEDDQRARLVFTQTHHNLFLGEARNQPQRRRAPPPPKRHMLHPQQRHQTPGHTLRKLNFIPPEDFREQHRYTAHRIPVDPRLLKYASHRYYGPRTKPQWRDAEPPPAVPRIVHPSDVQSEAVASYASTVPAYYPVGRMAMNRNNNNGKKRPAGSGRAVLQFTSADPPSQPRLPTSASTSQQATRSGDNRSNPPTSYKASGSTTSVAHVNPHPIHPLSFNCSGATNAITSSGKASAAKLSAPYIPQHPVNPPQLQCHPSRPSFLPYTPVEPDQHSHDEPEPDEYDDLVPLVLDNGEEVMIPRRELEAVNDMDLDRMSDPCRSKGVDEIDGSDFPDPSQTRAASRPPTQPTGPSRRVFGDITGAVVPREGLSGLSMTDHLLDIASRAADKPVHRPDNPHERRLAERRQRLEAMRKEGPVDESPEPEVQQNAPERETRAPPTPSSSGLGLPPLQTPNAFASHQVPRQQSSNPLPVHPKQRAKSYGALRASQALSSQPLVLPARLYPQQAVPTPQPPENEHEPPTPSRKRAKSIVNSQYKPPTRVNATPPPEPTVSDQVNARLASAFPAFARAFVAPQPSPPPPPRLGVGLVPPPGARPIKSALKRSRTSVV